MVIIWILENVIIINVGLDQEVAATIVRISQERGVEALHLEKEVKVETEMSFRGKSSVW